MAILRKNKNGYTLKYRPSHPACDGSGCVYEHRLVMEKHIGRYLSGEEVVHHINGNGYDNRIENLMLLSSQSDHRRIHLGWVKKNGEWFKHCPMCGRFLAVNKNNFYFRKTGKVVNVCKECAKMIAQENKQQRNEARRRRRMLLKQKK